MAEEVKQEEKKKSLFSCPQCGEDFKNYMDLAKHIKTQHGMPLHK